MLYVHRSTLCALAVAVVAALSGCASTKTISEVGFPLSESDVYITAYQNELDTEASSTNPGAAGGGVLGVLIASTIDSTRNRRAEEAVAELRDSLIDFAIADEFSRKIVESELPQQVSLIAPRILTDEPTADFQHDRDFIDIRPAVRLSNDLSALEVSILIREFELTNREQPRFSGFGQQYIFVHALPQPEGGRSRTDYAEAWLALGVEAIERLIVFGMDAAIEAAQLHFREGELALASTTRYRIPDYSQRARYHVWRETDELLWMLLRPTSDEIIIAKRDSVVPVN